MSEFRKVAQPALRPSSAARNIKRAADAERQMLAEMNNRVAQVKHGGKVRFIDTSDEAPAFYSKADMATILAHVKMPGDKGQPISAFEWWLEQAKRRQFTGVVFEPDPKKVPADTYNLFKGFRLEPKGKPADWSLFEDHIMRNICARNRASYSFFLDWCASLFQRPGHKIGVAVVLFGGVGCGKSVVSDILAECLGPEYCPVVDTPEALTGKHNMHLARALLIRIEEALHAKDPRHESRLKHLITGKTFLIEPKRVDAIEIESKCNLIFTTNKRHSVPATANERRFFCLHVADNNQKDGAFFEAMKQQMRDGGYAAFVASMLKRDISGRDFSKPPSTSLLSTQIVESMTGLEKWWRAALATGRLPFVRAPVAPEADLEWPDSGAWTVPKTMVQESANDYGRDFAGPPTPEAVGKFLQVNVPSLTRSRRQSHGDREHVYILPPLDECRRAFVEARPGLLLEHVNDAVPETSAADDDGENAFGRVIPFARSR